MLFESFDTAMMKFRQVLVYSMKWIIIAMLASAILAFAFLFLSVVVHVSGVQGRVERSRDAGDAIVDSRKRSSIIFDNTKSAKIIGKGNIF